MENILILEKRGCDFHFSDTDTKGSDVGNYRVTTFGDTVKGKDGKNYFVEFCHHKKYKYRTTNKRTGEPLKKAVKELVKVNALWVDTQYNDDRGSWRNIRIEQDINKLNLDYTKAGILQAVNQISRNCYNAVEILDTHKIYKISGYREHDILSNLENVVITQYYNGHPVYRLTGKNGNSFEYTDGRITN